MSYERARANPPHGTSSTGGYGLGWSVVTFDWAEGRLITHNGSNSMNLARIVIDPEQDLAVVVMTNFPGQAANTATGAALRHLFTAYAQ